MAETGGGSGTACAAVAGEAAEADEPSGDDFARMSGVADAVLYEGYLLYPYRRSSAKNRVRWQFGVLLPRDRAEADGPVVPGVSGSADSWYQQTECPVLVRRPGAVVRVRVRYLQLQYKQVEAAGADGRYEPVESLRTDDGTAHLTFEEAVPHEVALEWPLEELLRGPCGADAGAPAGAETELLPGGAGRVVRRRAEVRARTTVVAERLTDDLCRLRVRTENTGHARDAHGPRGEVLGQALLAAHTLIGGDGVEFVSLIDPPAALAEHVRGCRNAFTFPVLGGGPQETGGTGPVVLSAPIILPDRPQVAPESPGDLHDAAEIDEILTLRTMLLTDEEKAEARATDPRAAQILDRVDTMPREVFARLHGAIRSLTPAAPESTPISTAPRMHAAPAAPEVPEADAPREALTALATAAACEAHGPRKASAAPEADATAEAPEAPAPRKAAATPMTSAGCEAAGPGEASAAHEATAIPVPPEAGESRVAGASGDARAACAVPATAAPRQPPAPERSAWWLEGGDDGLSPASDTVVVGGVAVGRGARVRLRPRVRGADAQDMFLAGRSAEVAGVFHDVDGSVHLAVTVDDDPAAELHGWYGRFHYFRPDELEPLSSADAPGPVHEPRPQSPRPRWPAGRPEEGRPYGRP